MIVDPLKEMRSSSGVLISVYLNRPEAGMAATALKGLLRNLSENSRTADRPSQRSMAADLDRILAASPRVEAEPAPGYAIFASSVDDLFVFKTLTHGVADTVMVGPRPYLRPLRAAPKPLRSGILVADRGMARTFVSNGSLVDEIGEPLEADLGKPNFGGFGGYSEHVARGHAEAETTRVWKESISRLLQAHLERPFDYLAIGGREESIDEIGRMLHPYLARRLRADFPAVPQRVTPSSLRDQIAEIDDQVRRRRQEALAGRVCDTAWSGGSAVLGLSAVLQACNAQAVDVLAVAGPFARPGVVCDQCGQLERTGETCPVCGSEMFETEDVVAAAMEAVVASGGTVQQLRVASPLDVEGVGALTRFNPNPG